MIDRLTTTADHTIALGGDNNAISHVHAKTVIISGHHNKLTDVDGYADGVTE